MDSFDNADTLNQTEKIHHLKPKDTFGIVHVTIFDGMFEPREIDLSSFDKPVITFGRNEENDIRMRSEYVSRRHHGQFRFVSGQWVIEDIESLNGLILNGENIKSHILEDGDYIRIDDGIETTIGGLLMIVSKGDDTAELKTFDLTTRLEVSIGRDIYNDIVLDHVSVSKHHAIITVKDNKYYITDNNSTNGTLVNGKKVEHRHLLCEKDVILITNSQLIYSDKKISYYCYRKGISLNVASIVKKVDRNRKIICNDVSFSIKPCELVAIIGGSGAGKSTIMNCISGYSVPTKGSVSVNGIDLYNNFDALKNIIGYVPQQDIVFNNLTVADMLGYAARLRLPKDFSKAEYQQIISRAIDIVELTAHKDKLIKNLSGGQKKRASIAVELLSDPNLFFLDEPASGLDPGTESNLMKTLKGMAVSGKTVVFVTHSILNLHLCDKIIIMGTGGNLCFCGSYKDAISFFEIENFVDVFNLVSDKSQEYKEKYLTTQQKAVTTNIQSTQKIVRQTKKHGRGHQISVLCKRHIHIVCNDRIRFFILLLQAPLLAALISFVANGQQFEQYNMTKSLLFAMSCSAFWIGILNSIQEICKERHILKREYMTGLRLDSYILSKIIVMAFICAIQAFLLTTVFVILVGQPDTGVVFGAYLELILITFLTALAASATGIFVSSLFNNADRAMTVAPILLMPQLLFSGLIFELDGASELISWVAACRFSMEGYGTTANLNNLPTGLEQQGFMIERVEESFFTFTASHFAFSVGMLCIYVLVFSTIAGIVLRGIKKN